MSKKMLEVVPPLPRDIAKKAFEQWRLENRKIADRLSAEDIIIDWIRAKEGKTLARYRVALEEWPTPVVDTAHQNSNAQL